MAKGRDKPKKETKKPPKGKPKPKAIADQHGWNQEGYVANPGNAPRHTSRVVMV